MMIRMLLIIGRLRLRRRRHAVAHLSNTASHDYHEKSSSRVSISMVLRYNSSVPFRGHSGILANVN